MRIRFFIDIWHNWVKYGSSRQRSGNFGSTLTLTDRERQR
jgi:hypothetical protein